MLMDRLQVSDELVKLLQGEQRLIRSLVTPGLGNSGYAQLGAGIK